MANTSPQPVCTTTEGSLDPAYNTPIPGLSLDGTKDFSLAEIFSLPEDERNHLARCMGVLSWEPLTFKVVGTPGQKLEPGAREAMRRAMQNPEPIPDEDDDEMSQGEKRERK
jgi:hypothetical protein